MGNICGDARGVFSDTNLHCAFPTFYLCFTLSDTRGLIIEYLLDDLLESLAVKAILALSCLMLSSANDSLARGGGSVLLWLVLTHNKCASLEWILVVTYPSVMALA